MRKRRNLLLIELRMCLRHSFVRLHFMLLFLLVAIATFLPPDFGAGLGDPIIINQNWNILEQDIFAITIQPAVENWSIESARYPLRLFFSRNETGKTVVEMQPLSAGTYNIIITFRSNETWKYTVGVYYSRSLDFYKNYGNSTGSFVTFQVESGRQPGDYSMNIILNSYRQPSSSLFRIELPTPVNAALFIAAAGFITYLNIFLVFDTYFKNKKELVSSRRWLLCGVVIIISFVVVYELYTLSTFP